MTGIIASIAFKSALGWMKNAWAWIFENNIHLMLAISFVIGLWGFFGWHQAARWKAKAVADSTQIIAMKKASEQAAADQKRQHDNAQAAYNDIAKELNDANDQRLAAYQRGVDDYKRSHSLSRYLPASVDTPAALAQGGDTGRAADTPADPVVVEGADIDTCTINYNAALTGYELGQKLIQAGLAK